MKVLMISKACLVGVYQTKLEEMAQFDDVDLTVLAPPAWLDASGAVELERSHTEGYQLLVDPIRFNGQFHTYHFPTLKKRLATLQPDILHIDEEPYNLATWLAWRQGRQVGAKTLFFSWQNLEKQYPIPFRQMEKQVLDGVDYAIMGNQEVAQVWRNKGYCGPYQIIPQFGVDPDIFSPPAHRDPGRGFIIGAANRRLVPEKGVDLLLYAAADLPGIWRLHIAGDGPTRPSLEQLARELNIADRVHFDGPISSARMPAYLQQLDVLVLSSRTLPHWKEQFGRVLVEAMACETAVVGACSGEIPHVIGEAGLTFAEDDTDDLRRQLMQLMQVEGLRNEYGRKGRQHVLAQYTQRQIAAQTVAVYRDMIAK
ncbi:MAG: glycosyltransferase family 4 protein [Chloroflexi bacterium]|nr:glycosyltransferase family 4 protein [Chloroflexota bacterium]